MKDTLKDAIELRLDDKDMSDEDIRKDLVAEFTLHHEHGLARLEVYLDRDPDIMLRLLALAETTPFEEPDINVCPKCGSAADQGFDRGIPPSPYYCSKCDPPPKPCLHTSGSVRISNCPCENCRSYFESPDEG